MVSTVKVDVVAPRVATGTTTLGVSGDKLLIPSGVTLTNSGTASGFASGFDRYTVVTASDATFDLQSTTTKLVIEVQASGGNSGSSGGGGYNGGSGGGGAYAKKLLSSMIGTDTLNITIGAVPGIGFYHNQLRWGRWRNKLLWNNSRRWRSRRHPSHNGRF